ncbi:ABC transporter permease [Alkalicella caledoniensis]|uniref:ABC transporter permease n=1 Tax=Alkalicella caledoniensis TaxID=2731377 RepID=A0A7G9WAW8_ALKCA|nr:ABC transporter permease [Alkalicella caledoniensis]QNO15830.1 ABC transporter permease [Alkalicella caledoniensis]
MLKRLLKWEIKATARLFVPLYVTLILFAVINRLLKPFYLIESSSSFSLQLLISYITIFAYFALIVGVVAMTLIIMIQRFYKSLLGDEGYLMFTLPTQTWKHVFSKLLVATLWTVVSIVTTFTSIIIISGVKLGDIFRAPAGNESFLAALKEITGVFGSFGVSMVPVMSIIGIIVNILMIYTAISLGHLFQKNKLIASFAMYALVYMFNQFVTGFTIFTFGTLFFRQNLGNMTEPPPSTFSTIFLAIAIYLLISAAAYFTVTTTLLHKKLNLE